MSIVYFILFFQSAPMKFFYQICETRSHKVKIPPFFLKAEEPKSQILNKDSKSVKNNYNEKVDGSIKLSKSVSVVPKSKCDVKSDIINPSNKTVKTDNRKMVENPNNKDNESSPTEQLVATKKSELTVNSDIGEVKDNKKADEPFKENSEGGRLESGLHNSSDSKILVTKTNNVVLNPVQGKEEDSKKVKTNENNERLLLNPISGQLETVPSTSQNKLLTKGKEATEDKKENEEKKKTVPESELKKVQTDTPKEIKKSCVNLLKSFRKDKSFKDHKVDVKNTNGNTLTITPVAKPEKPLTNVSVDIKNEKKGSEYDFDGTSPPSKIMPLQEYSKMAKYQKSMSIATTEKQSLNNWMSLQDFRMHMLKENNLAAEDPLTKDRRKSVPSLFRIGSEGNKKSGRKTPNGKLSNNKSKSKPSPTIINIKTENEDSSKTEIKIEVPKEDADSPPKPIKIETKGGEYIIKHRENEQPIKSVSNEKSPTDSKKVEENKVKNDPNQSKELLKGLLKRSAQEKPDGEGPKKLKSNVEEKKNDNFGAIDLSKTDTSPRSGKNPLENLMDLASKSRNGKSDENMVEALISAAQKQSIEPLLKIPQYSQTSKNTASQSSPPLAKNISSNDISQALQFFKDLRSDIKVLEAKSQLSPNSFLEQFSPKTTNLEPIQLYQQHIDLIRRLKRQQMSTVDTETPQRKRQKLSPSSDSKRKSPLEGKPKMSPQAEEAAQLKSSLERTLSQIQEQMEIQSRMVAAQNYKNLPALLQFYNRPPAFCSGPTSPSKSNSNKPKPSSHSPNSQKSPTSRKSPPSITSPSGSLPLAMSSPETSFFNPQNYSHLINAGLNSEMTFHQMFQNYLNQQDKMNQIKHTQAMIKKPPPIPSAKSISELYGYGSQPPPKKQEPGALSTVQKT